MCSMKNALSNLVRGRYNYCCLCFTSIVSDSVKVSDELIINTKCSDERDTITYIYDVLLVVLGPHFLNTINMNNIVCKECIDLAVKSYLFIKTCQQNLSNIQKYVDNLSNCLNGTEKKLNFFNAVYVYLDTYNVKSKNYYDYKCKVTTHAAAFKRSQKLIKREEDMTFDNQLKTHSISKSNSDAEFLVPNSNELKEPTMSIEHLKETETVTTNDMAYDSYNPKCTKCNICFREYPSYHKLRIHFLRIHAPQEHKCSKRTYGNPNLSDVHYQESHITATCQTCQKTFLTINSYKSHLLTHKSLNPDIASDISVHKSANPNVSQNKTNKKKVTSIPIATSNMTSDPDDPKCTKCKICLQEYHSRHKLRLHYIRIHAPKVFKCAECPRTYGSPNLLQAHVKERHTSAICHMCGKMCYSLNSYKFHLWSHKGNIVCTKCGKFYKNNQTYSAHIRHNRCMLGDSQGDTNNKCVFECDLCGKKIGSKASLSVHMKFAHGNGKYHLCLWCDKKFTSQSALKYHMVTHTKEKNYICDVCGDKFVTKTSLLYHTRLHTGETPFKCKLCDKKFVNTSRRADHMRRHHLAPSLKCSVCPKKFKNHSCLQRHKKRHSNPESKLYDIPIEK